MARTPMAASAAAPDDDDDDTGSTMPAVARTTPTPILVGTPGMTRATAATMSS